MNAVVVLGDVMADVVARLEGPIALGSDSPARVELRGGGQAANTAAWLAAAAAPVALVGRVGEDAPGRDAAARLARLGVEVHLAVDHERPTGTCVVLVTPDGERTMFPDAGAADALAPSDLPEVLVRAGAHLHVAGYALLRAGSRPAALSAIERARRARMTISVDPSSAAFLSEDFLQLVSGVGLLLPNSSEAFALSGERDPERAARSLARHVSEVVVTLAGDGALWTNGRELVRAAAPAAAARDSTGAGDAFAAGFLAARMQGADPAGALTAGCSLARKLLSAPAG